MPIRSRFIASFAFALFFAAAAQSPAIAADKQVKFDHTRFYSKGAKQISGKPHCGGFHKGKNAKLIVSRGLCYRCPAGTDRLRLLGKTRKRMCISKKLAWKYEPAKTKTAKKGITTKKKCGKGWKLDRFADTCYRCPTGYGRSTRPVTDAKACHTMREKSARATYLGAAQCKKGFVGGVLRNACFTCPTGYARGMDGNSTSCGRFTFKLPKTLVSQRPANLAATAVANIRPYQSLIRQAMASLPKAQAHIRAGKDPKSFKDKKLSAEAENTKGLKHWSIGLVADGTSPFSIGGNVSHEWLFYTRRAKTKKPKMVITGSLTGTPIVAIPGGDVSVFFAFYFVDQAQIKGFSWGVEVGVPVPPAHVGAAGTFTFPNRKKQEPVRFAGFAVGGGLGAGMIEADAGANYSIVTWF